MSEAKFTKGPWEGLSGGIWFSDDSYFLDSNRDCSWVMVGRREEALAIIPDYEGSASEMKANAHLIAVAPDMYHELQRDINRINKILSEFSGITNQPLIAERDRKVLLLAKARGEV